MNLSSLFWILFCSLQISGNNSGSLILTWKVTKCILRSKGSCLGEKNLPFFPVDCPSNSCLNRARFTFSIEQLQELSSTTWDMECDVSFCYSEVRIYQPLLMFHINTTLYSFNVFNSVTLNSENLPVWQTYGHFELLGELCFCFFPSIVDMEEKPAGIWNLPSHAQKPKVSSV